MLATLRFRTCFYVNWLNPTFSYVFLLFSKKLGFTNPSFSPRRKRTCAFGRDKKGGDAKESIKPLGFNAKPQLFVSTRTRICIWSRKNWFQWKMQDLNPGVYALPKHRVFLTNDPQKWPGTPEASNVIALVSRT